MAVTAQPAAHRHAERLLLAHRVKIGHVVRVDPDAILYVDSDGRAMTAWLTAEPLSGRVDLYFDAGFAAWPPEDD